MYHYFVSYSYQYGFGHCDVARDTPITSIEDINEMVKDLQIQFNLSNIVILNFQLLRKESDAE